MIKKENYALSNGVLIPKVGYGTWQITDKDECVKGTLWALAAGYRHIDTASVYKNEEFIGQALKKTKVKREDLFITSKLAGNKKGYDVTIEEFNQSLKRLKLDYLDLYLIHAPRPWGDVSEIDYTPQNIESWKAMIDLYHQGKIKAIGVSNFSKEDIQALVLATNFVPHVNQIKVHIGHNNSEIKNYCQENNILVEAYCPLASGAIFSQTGLLAMAKKYNVSLAQLALRWCLDINTLPLPKSVTEKRIYENIELDFTLSENDIEILKQWQFE